MTSVDATCKDCGRDRKPREIFCECGAFLDYSVPTGEQRTDGEPDGETAASTAASESEWPPGPYEPTSEPADTSGVSMRVVHCPNEECKALNPATLDLCWKCKTPIAQGVEAKPPWSLSSLLRQEKPPLPAGERDYPVKPFLGKDPRSLLRTGLIVAGVLLLAGALLVGAVKAWGPASAGATHGYGVAREALFPRFKPVPPSGVNPPRNGKDVNRLHPPFHAFDSNLSTYWKTTTASHVPDEIRVSFNPPAHHIDEVIVFAGDPTATTIVPSSLQMTFYRWEPFPSRHSDECGHPTRLFERGEFCHPAECEQPTRFFDRGAFCVIDIAPRFDLKNTPTPQRFSTGKQADVARVVITIRGVHRSNNKNAKAAITDIEFFDRD